MRMPAVKLSWRSTSAPMRARMRKRSRSWLTLYCGENCGAGHVEGCAGVDRVEIGEGAGVVVGIREEIALVAGADIAAEGQRGTQSGKMRGLAQFSSRACFMTSCLDLVGHLLLHDCPGRRGRALRHRWAGGGVISAAFSVTCATTAWEAAAASAWAWARALAASAWASLGQFIGVVLGQDAAFDQALEEVDREAGRGGVRRRAGDGGADIGGDAAREERGIVAGQLATGVAEGIAEAAAAGAADPLTAGLGAGESAGASAARNGSGDSRHGEQGEKGTPCWRSGRRLTWSRVIWR